MRRGLTRGGGLCAASAGLARGSRGARAGLARGSRGARAGLARPHLFCPSARLQRGRQLTASPQDPAVRAWHPGPIPLQTHTQAHTGPVAPLVSAPLPHACDEARTGQKRKKNQRRFFKTRCLRRVGAQPERHLGCLRRGGLRRARSDIGARDEGRGDCSRWPCFRSSSHPHASVFLLTGFTARRLRLCRDERAARADRPRRASSCHNSRQNPSGSRVEVSAPLRRCCPFTGGSAADSFRCVRMRAAAARR